MNILMDLINRSGKKMKSERRYGDDKTIHRNGEVNVELDVNGNVVAVWFRCQPIPFSQITVTPDRAAEMKLMYEGEIPDVTAIVLREDDPE